jgi:hypothetical protein
MTARVGSESRKIRRSVLYFSGNKTESPPLTCSFLCLSLSRKRKLLGRKPKILIGLVAREARMAFSIEAGPAYSHESAEYGFGSRVDMAEKAFGHFRNLYRYKPKKESEGKVRRREVVALREATQQSFFSLQHFLL